MRVVLSPSPARATPQFMQKRWASLLNPLPQLPQNEAFLSPGDGRGDVWGGDEGDTDPMPGTLGGDVASSSAAAAARP